MTSDSEGVSTEAWTDVDLIWVHIAPLSAQEIFQAAQTEEKITHDVTMRWRADVSAKMRFLFQPRSQDPQRVFLIHTLLDLDEAHRELDSRCEEIVTSLLGDT